MNHFNQFVNWCVLLVTFLSAAMHDIAWCYGTYEPFKINAICKELGYTW